MRLALLPEEVFLQLRFGVAQEFNVAPFWVEEQVAWEGISLCQYARLGMGDVS